MKMKSFSFGLLATKLIPIFMLFTRLSETASYVLALKREMVT